MNKLFFFITVLLFLVSCTSDSTQEKFQQSRNNIQNVKQHVIETNMDDVLIGSSAKLFLLNDFLIIADHKSLDKQIHLFNKNNFHHLFSIAPFGEGPNEITNMGHIATNNARNEFYVSDHGKQQVLCYNIDSLLIDSLHSARIKMKMNEKEFLSKYHFLNDTLSIGLIIRPTGNTSFDQVTASWNMQTKAIRPMPYEHPDIKKKRIAIAVSEQYHKYVEGYLYHDLMTICDLNGQLLYNIYGPAWDDKVSNKDSYYQKVVFYKDMIIALFSGEKTFYNDQMRGVRSLLPTQFLVFDLEGNYRKTLDVGYHISDFCCDEENDRIILNFDDEIQFGYLNLKDISR